MKINSSLHVKRFTAVLCCFTFSNHQILAGKYDDVFKPAIYEQRETLKRLQSRIDNHKISEEQVDEELVTTLLKAKEDALEKYSLGRLEERIQFLKKKYVPAKKKELWTEMLSSITTNIPMIGGGIKSLCLSLITEFFGKKIIEENFREVDAEFIRQKIGELRLEIEDLKSGLPLEPILDLEKAYVKHKRKMNDSALEHEIEKGLLGLRKTDYYVGLKTEDAISYALKLPVKKAIPYESVVSPASRRALLDKIRNNPLIKSYDEKVRRELETIITNISDISSHSNPSSSQRRAYYFVGEPSSGKTSAAKEIAEILELPYYEITVQDSSELAKEKLEGVDPLWGDSNPGFLASALMASTKGKGAVKNPVLIINDLDRILLEGNPSVYNFLLAYLDPNKKSYYNPYFKIDVDISSLIVIITANRKTNEKEVKEINEKGIDALKTRISQTVEFPSLSEEAKKAIASEELNKIVGGYPVLKPFNFDYVDPSTICIKYNFECLPPHFQAIKPVENKETHFLQIAGDKETQKNEYDPRSKSILESVRELTAKIASNRQASYGLAFELDTGIKSEDRDKTTIRQLIDTGKLSHSVSRFVNQITDLSSERFAQAVQNQNEDNLTSEQLFMQAAICGHEEASYALAQLAKDDDEKEFWLRKGAELRHAESLDALGEIYEEKQERDEATKYYMKAFLLGCDRHETWLVDYYSQYADKDEAMNQLIKLCHKKPKSKKLAKALKTVGDKFASMKSIEHEKAYECYSIAMMHGSKEARDALYDLGNEVERKKGLGNKTAMKYYLEAAENSDPMAQFKLGWLAWLEDDAIAFKWAQRSAEQGCGLGQWLLGRSYHYGFEKGGPSVDLKKALDNYRKAYQKGIPFAAVDMILLWRFNKGISEKSLGTTISKLIKEVVNSIKPLQDQSFKHEDLKSCKQAFQKSKLEEYFFGGDSEWFDMVGWSVLLNWRADSENPMKQFKGLDWHKDACKLRNGKRCAGVTFKSCTLF
jgi:TPR repeat protein